MQSIRQILKEIEDKDKKDKKDKIVFIETDPQTEFPSDTIIAIQKEINKGSKDLEKEWGSAVELVSYAFDELKVPKPQAYLKNRWQQYQDLIRVAVKNLHDSRGLKGSWVRTI